MESTIFVMSLSGTVAFLLYKAIYPLARRHFHPGWRYAFLKIVLAFYLLPVPWVLDKISHMMIDPLPFHQRGMITEALVNYNVPTTTAIGLVRYLTVELALTVLCVTISLLLLCIRSIQYIKGRYTWLHSGQTIPAERFQAELSEFRFKQTIRFMSSPKAATPFVIGVWRPTVVIPADMVEQADDQAISQCVRHELFHIQNRDPLYRLLGLAAVCLHWFNPFCWFLRREIVAVSEICCDRAVLSRATEGRKSYFNLLIAQAEREKATHQFSASFTDKNGGEIKRRLLEIPYMDTAKLTAPAVLFCLVVLLLGMGSTLFYEPFPGGTNLPPLSQIVTALVDGPAVANPELANAQPNPDHVNPYAMPGMDITGRDPDDWQVIPVSDGVVQEIKDLVFQNTKQNYGMSGSGRDINDVIADYLPQVAVEDRTNAARTLTGIYFDEVERIGSFIHAKDPSWTQWGQPFDTSILDDYR